MYFRRKTSAGRAYLQIVESRRDGDQVRQQVIARAWRSPAGAPARRRGGSRRFADRRARPRSCGGNTWRRLRMLVRTQSRDSTEKQKSIENVALHFRENSSRI